MLGSRSVPPASLAHTPACLPASRRPLRAQAPPLTLDTYKASVDAFKASFCSAKGLPVEDAARGEADDEREKGAAELTRSFWRIVRTECEPLVVPYGAGGSPPLHTFPPGHTFPSRPSPCIDASQPNSHRSGWMSPCPRPSSQLVPSYHDHPRLSPRALRSSPSMARRLGHCDPCIGLCGR